MGVEPVTGRWGRGLFDDAGVVGDVVVEDVAALDVAWSVSTAILWGEDVDEVDAFFGEGALEFVEELGVHGDAEEAAFHFLDEDEVGAFEQGVNAWIFIGHNTFFCLCFELGDEGAQFGFGIRFFSDFFHPTETS